MEYEPCTTLSIPHNLAPTTILRSIPQFPAILCQIHDDRLNNNDAHAVSTFTKNHTVQEAAAVIQANMLEVKCSCYFHQNTDSSSSNFHSLLNAHKNIVSDKRKKEARQLLHFC